MDEERKKETRKTLWGNKRQAGLSQRHLMLFKGLGGLMPWKVQVLAPWEPVARDQWMRGREMTLEVFSCPDYPCIGSRPPYASLELSFHAALLSPQAQHRMGSSSFSQHPLSVPGRGLRVIVQ